MATEHQKDAGVENAIKDLFLGSVPERAEELSSFWSELDLVFLLLSDDYQDGRLIMDAGSYRYIRFNHRVLRSFWIASFAAWEGFRAVADSSESSDVNLTRFHEIVAAFEAVVQNDLSDEVPLPAGIPEPGAFPDGDVDPQAKAASELAIIAVAWALLHEVRHIRHQREGTSASELGNTQEARHREEFSCDEFATRFILGHIERYADESGDDLVLVRRKRELAIYYALFAMILLSRDCWEASETHPSVQARIDSVCNLIGDGRDEMALANAHAAFLTLRELWSTAPMISVT